MIWLIGSLISALALLPLLVRFGYDYGFFPLFCQRSITGGILGCNSLPFQVWGFWIWISFLPLAGFVFIKSWFARLFLLSAFTSTIINISDKINFFNKGFFATYLFFLFAAALTGLRHKKVLTYVILGAALVNTGWAIAQYFGYWWPLTPESGQANLGGFFDNPNSLAAFLAISIPLFLALPKYFKFLAIFPTFGLWLASNTMGLAAFAAAILLIAFKLLSLKLALLALVSVLVFGVVYIAWNDPPTVSHLFRFRVWRASVTMALEKPLHGWGFGSFFFMFDNRYPQLQDGQGRRWASPHNEYLQVWFEQGLLGLMLVLGYCTYLMRLMWRSTGRRIYYAASMLALMVNALGFFPMRVPLIAATAAIILGGLEYGDTQEL